eukprot:655612-Pleurochrysis_carterae.AAC.2
MLAHDQTPDSCSGWPCIIVLALARLLVLAVAHAHRNPSSSNVLIRFHLHLVCFSNLNFLADQTSHWAPRSSRDMTPRVLPLAAVVELSAILAAALARSSERWWCIRAEG